MSQHEKWEELARKMLNRQAPENLYTRIITVVPHMDQIAPGHEHRAPSGAAFMLARFISEWRYGLAFKIAAFFCVVVIGFSVGQAQVPQDNDSLRQVLSTGVGGFDLGGII